MPGAKSFLGKVGSRGVVCRGTGITCHLKLAAAVLGLLNILACLCVSVSAEGSTETSSKGSS